MKRRLRVALALGAAFVALWFLTGFLREWRDRTWIEARIEALRALGEPTTREELEDPLVPDEQNAFTALEAIAAQIFEEERDPEQAFPLGGPEHWSPEERALIEKRLAAHPERSGAIAAALERPSYRSPLIDDAEPALWEPSSDDPNQLRNLVRAMRRYTVPHKVQEWLLHDLVIQSRREELRPEAQRFLSTVVDLALRAPAVDGSDLLARLVLTSMAHGALRATLEHPRCDVGAIETLLRQLEAAPLPPDPLRLFRAERALLFELVSRQRSTALRQQIEALERPQPDLDRAALSSLGGPGWPTVMAGIAKLSAERRCLAASLAARRFEASEQRWPKSLEELEARMPAGWSVPEGVLLEATEKDLRLVAPFPPGQNDERYELLLRRAR